MINYAPTAYIITIQPTLESPVEILTTTDSYLIAISIAGIESATSYRTHIYDETDTLLLTLALDGAVLYSHGIPTEEEEPSYDKQN